jgi:signal transduction histidine kinase
MMARRSLRARIALAAVAALALVGALAGSLLVAAVQRDGRAAVDRDLEQRAQDLARRPFARRQPGRGDAGLLAGAGTFVQVAFRGQVIEQRGDVPAQAPPLPERDGFQTVEIGGVPWRSLTFTADSEGELRLRVLSSLAPTEARVASVRRLVLLLGFAALVATALAAWAFTALAVRPLARLRAGAERVTATQDLSAPLPDDEGPDEVRSLARALNDMLARLRASTDALERALLATRRFAADAGHELRTPLTALRADLDALERNPDLPAAERATLLREMAAEQERMVHLLAGLQALARGEAAESLPREEVELGDVVDAALYAARRRHPRVTYELEDSAGEATVRGWGEGLRLLVDNLLDNAALHGRPGGRVRVTLALEGSDVVLAVEDDGPGLPDQERARVLEPFARGPRASAPGTGLGLAIVAQQAALHGGRVELGPSALGGLAVRVPLPRYAPVAAT